MESPAKKIRRIVALGLLVLPGTAASLAHAGPPALHFEVPARGVGEFESAPELCAYLHAATQVAAGRPIATGCATDPRDSEKARRSRAYAYQIRIENTEQGVAVTVENGSARDPDAEFAQVSWTVRSDADFKTEFERLLSHNVLPYDRSRESLARAGTELLSESGKQPDGKAWLRALSELAVSLGVGAAWYWSSPEVNATDWDYGLDSESLRKKLVTGEAIRFDNNTIALNSPGHPFSGALFYGLARANGFSALESFVFAFAASASWEYLVEFREVVSINDMVFTPLGGAVLGEVFYQLYHAFRASKADDLTGRVLAAIFGSPASFLDWLNRHHSSTKETPARFRALSLALQAGLRTAHGAYQEPATDASRTAAADAGFKIRGEMIHFEEDGWDLHVPMSELRLEGDASSELQRVSLAVQAAWLGYAHVRERERMSVINGDSPAVVVAGRSFFVGLASGYEHGHLHSGELKEPLAIVHLLGPTAEILLYDGAAPSSPREAPRLLRIRADLFPDFAAIRTLAYEPYAEIHDVSGAKSILQMHQYYFAFGMTAALSVSGRWNQFEAGAETRFQFYDSIEGRDREQESVTDDFSLSDRVLSGSAWVHYLLPGDRARIGLVAQDLERHSRIREVEASGGTQRYLVEFSWVW